MPTIAEALNQALQHHQAGALQQAEQLYRQVLQAQGRLEAAALCYCQAPRLKPGYAEAHNNLGYALQKQGKLEEALPCYHRALDIKPDFPEAHNNLGNAFLEQGKLEEAAACY